jgi:hypothetical protein
MLANIKKHPGFFIAGILVYIMLRTFVLPWYELREREVEIEGDLKMSELSEVWQMIEQELDLEDEEVYLGMYSDAYSVEMEKRDEVYARDFKFYFYYEAGANMVIRQARYRDGELEIRRAHIDSSDHQWEIIPMDHFMGIMGDVDYIELMEIGDTKSDKYYMFMERYLAPGKEIQASQRLFKMKHVLCADSLYRALEHEEEVVLGKDFMSFSMLPIIDVMHEVVEVSNDKERVIRTHGIESIGQNLILYVPIDDAEYVKVLRPVMAFDVGGWAINKKQLEKEGMRSIEIRGDGYVSYMMPKKAHAVMMTMLKYDFSDYINSFVESSEYPYIREISFNSDFSLFDIVIEDSKYVQTEHFEDLQSYLSSLGKIYGLWNGVRNTILEINVFDQSSGELIEKNEYSLF